MINVQGIVDNISIYHLINRNLYIQFKKKIKIEKKADCLPLMRKIIINKKLLKFPFSIGMIERLVIMKLIFIIICI